jgi:predicted MFS family arabinose efflux permease
MVLLDELGTSTEPNEGAALAVAGACLGVAISVQPLRAGFDQADSRSGPGGTHFLAGFALVYRMPALRRLALSSIAFAATQLSFATFLVTFLTERAGISLVTAGIIMAVAQGAGVVGRILFGWVADRFIPPGLLLTLLGLGMALASLATGFITAGWPAAGVFAATALLGVTGLAWNGVYHAEVARLAPEGAAGTATGGALAVTFLGIVFGPAAFSAVVSASGSYTLAFSLLAVGASIGGFGVRHIGR